MRKGYAHCFWPINNEQKTLTDILVRNFYRVQSRTINSAINLMNLPTLLI